MPVLFPNVQLSIAAVGHIGVPQCLNGGRTSLLTIVNMMIVGNVHLIHPRVPQNSRVGRQATEAIKLILVFASAVRFQHALQVQEGHVIRLEDFSQILEGIIISFPFQHGRESVFRLLPLFSSAQHHIASEGQHQFRFSILQIRGCRRSFQHAVVGDPGFCVCDLLHTLLRVIGQDDSRARRNVGIDPVGVDFSVPRVVFHADTAMGGLLSQIGQLG